MAQTYFPLQMVQDSLQHESKYVHKNDAIKKNIKSAQNATPESDKIARDLGQIYAQLLDAAQSVSHSNFSCDFQLNKLDEILCDVEEQGAHPVILIDDRNDWTFDTRALASVAYKEIMHDLRRKNADFLKALCEPGIAICTSNR